MVPLLTLTLILAAATRGFNKMQYEMLSVETAQPLLRLILIGLMALIGLTVAKTLIIYILGLIVAIALLVYFLNRLFPLVRSLKSARRDTKGILNYSLPAYFSGLVDSFGGNLQTILLGSLNTVASAGIFAATSQISLVSRMFNMSLGKASNPIIASLHGEGELAEMNRFYQTTAKWMFTVNLLFFVVFITFPSEILNIFGRDFVEGTSALVILTIRNLAIAGVGVAGGVINMTGRSSVKLMNSVVYSVLSIILNFLLIPQWGVVGAATAALIPTLVVSALQVIIVFRMFHVLPFNVTFVKPVVAGVLAYLVGLFIHQSFQTEGNLFMLAVSALIMCFTFVGLVFALGLSNEDRVVIEGFRNRLSGMFFKSRSKK
jgi:O-antigen/teichoic acid export membrane protein